MSAVQGEYDLQHVLFASCLSDVFSPTLVHVFVFVHARRCPSDVSRLIFDFSFRMMSPFQDCECEWTHTNMRIFPLVPSETRI